MVTEADIRRLADQIARDFHPQQIFLFGSRANGEPRHDSDVDLLVVMSAQGDRNAKALEIRRTFDVKFPLDIIVREPDEMIWRYHGWDPLVRSAVDHGRLLFESLAA